MPVTAGDFVTWTATGTPRANPSSANAIGAALTRSGWRSVRVQTAAGAMQITAYAPQTWPTSTEIGNLFQSIAQSAGWSIARWDIKSAGEDWFITHPQDRPKADNTTTYLIAGGVGLLLLVVLLS
jgi:hypothetical protein